MIRNNAEGKLIGRQPGRSIDLVRNPRRDAKTDFRPAHVDEIRVEEGNMQRDRGQPPHPQRVRPGAGRHARRRRCSSRRCAARRTRSRSSRCPGFRMMSMNTTIKPFDDLNVRRAVVAALDRDALLRTRGGERYGEVASHFLPPGFPGFEEGGGARAGRWTTSPSPRATSISRAAYLRKAGYARRGTTQAPGAAAHGRDEPRARAARGGGGAPPARAASASASTSASCPQDVLYERFCNRPAARVALCPNVGFFADFRDAESLLRPVFDGRRILPRENLNFSQLDDPQINAAMDAASRLAPARIATGRGGASTAHRGGGARGAVGVGHGAARRLRGRQGGAQPATRVLGPVVLVAQGRRDDPGDRLA